MQLFEIPELTYSLMDSFMYFPNMLGMMQYVIHFMPRTMYSALCANSGFDKKLHIDLGNLPMLTNNDMGGTSSKNLLHLV